MGVELSNSILSARIEDTGAELKSLKEISTGVEYIWQSDPAWWSGSEYARDLDLETLRILTHKRWQRRQRCFRLFSYLHIERHRSPAAWSRVSAASSGMVRRIVGLCH